MSVDPGTMLAASGMVVGVVVWLVRLEGRMNVTDAKSEDLKADVIEIKADVKTLLRKA